METAHVAGRRTLPPGRRTLPPVPRPADGSVRRRRGAPLQPVAEPDAGSVAEPSAGPAVEASAEPTVEPPAGPVAEPGAARVPPPPHRRAPADGDAAQRFVARLRAAAASFAAAAGARSAVVPEAVPPARHRRARCRVVLRRVDGTELDLTFLGPAAGRRGQLPTDFEELIQEWLRTGQPRDPHWVLVDPDAPAGLAIDLSAWRPAS